MNPMLQSFLSTALPIVIAVLFGTWANNKRLDDFARRLDRIETLLDNIRKEIGEEKDRITRLNCTPLNAT
jgi:hypothetical protein